MCVIEISYFLIIDFNYIINKINLFVKIKYNIIFLIVYILLFYKFDNSIFNSKLFITK